MPRTGPPYPEELVEGKPTTTHWAFRDNLRAGGEVVGDQVVWQGNNVSGAGSYLDGESIFRVECRRWVAEHLDVLEHWGLELVP